MKRDIAVAAQFAEILVSHEYRQAMTTSFEGAATPEEFVDQRSAAEELIVNNLRQLPAGAEQSWELRRQAGLAELGGIALGRFGAFIHKQGGESSPSNMSLTDLGAGRMEVVRTNSQIVGLNKIHEEPIDFMNDALDAIEAQGTSSTGPENYATTLKFFSDKFLTFPSSHLDPAMLKAVTDRCMRGFVSVAESDRPNFVEMTNIYFAIRSLPTGSFDKRYTEDIIGHSLEQLPTYNAKTLALMISSMSKLDLSDTGESAATLIDLALRKSSTMERTTNLVQTLRAISNLPPSSAAELTFDALLQLRNNLEQPQDLEGLDTINFALGHIVKNVISDPELSQKAKDLAEQCAATSVRLYRQKENAGNTTQDELAHLKSTVKRVIYNYNQI